MRPYIRNSELRDLRNSIGRSILLFLTDRCPVGCRHCSVNSLRDSPSISDFELFQRLLNGIANRPTVQNVGISGGEPFVEKRGLQHAVETLTDANKSIVLYTSGVWASGRTPAVWQRRVLSRANTVILSTDGYHAERIGLERFRRAAQAVRDEGSWLIVQLIDDKRLVESVTESLHDIFGAQWHNDAELSLVPLLAYGRAASLQVRIAQHRAATEIGRCTVLDSPVVRYDGVVIACCNEVVQMGRGPDNLRARVTDEEELNQSLDSFHEDAMLRVMSYAGPSVLSLHPSYHDLASQKFGSICDFCWKAREKRVPADVLMSAMVRMLKDGRLR